MSDSPRRVVLINNGSFYVGPPLATLLAERGHDVVVGDASAELLTHLDAAGVRVVNVPGVTDRPDQSGMDELVTKGVEAFGHIDAAAMFSGIVVTGRFLDSTPADLQRVVAGCVEQPYFFLKSVVPVMLRQGHGQILVITSASGSRPTFGAPLYSSMRAAANMMARNVAEEVARKGIQVNVVGTNFMDFPEFLRASGANDPDVRKKVEAQVPFGRLGTLDEFAHFCLPYLDGTSRFATGQVVNFAGGWA